MENKKNIYKIIAGYVLAIITIMAAFAACTPGKEEQAEQVPGRAREDKSIIAWGEVKYTEAYELAVDFPCTVASVEVKEGDEVEFGDVLATLDMTEYNETVKKLSEQVAAGKASLRDAIQDTSALEADIARLKKDITTKTAEYSSGSKSELQLLENSLERAEKELSNAKEDLALNQKLYEEGAVPEEVLDQFADIVEQKEKAVSDIKDNISMTRRVLKEELDALSTDLQYKQVQLDKMRESNSVNLERLSSSLAIYESDLNIMKNKAQKPYLSGGKIVSNLDRGIVRNISIINGSSLGQQNANHKAMELIDAETIVVSAEVPEEFIDEIDTGAEVKIIPAANKDLVIKGRVSQVPSSAIEKDGERIVRVEVIPDENPEFIKPGYSADVIFKRKNDISD